jgi:hypothetical protein
MSSTDPDALNPIVEWGPPLTVTTFDEESKSLTLSLPGGAMQWKVTTTKK